MLPQEAGRMGDSLLSFVYDFFMNRNDITFFPFRWK